MSAGGGKTCKVLVASLRTPQQMVALADLGHEWFTIAPAIAHELMSCDHSIAAHADFEATISRS